MDELTINHFPSFFHALHGTDPFPWQERLAAQVCDGAWPQIIDLPTASGKTACLDIAVFAMALRRQGPRRIFFVVDRRIVVDSAADRMEDIAQKLRDAQSGILKTVAARLRAMAQGDNPLDTYVLRGGIYRDDSWIRSPLQPTLVASTVDQVGSRLLFRGYGVWDKQWPIHAALIANDALILLDEAHCSKPFAETLHAIRRYRTWSKDSLDASFTFVEMTATPSAPGEAFRLDESDYRDPKLNKRLFAAKPARLSASTARLKDFAKLADTLVQEALALAAEPGTRRIAIMVNRVKTAKLVFKALEDRGHRAHLLIGRMRPIDRMNLPADIAAMLSGHTRDANSPPTFVVATQCLEVGADLDFDALVTECASIDALLQRFGRLNRLGSLQDTGIAAQSRIVVSAPMTDEKYIDPIYGEALSRTWAWLQKIPDPDFAICSYEGTSTVRERLSNADDSASLRQSARSAPVLLPAHLDILAQTSPRPALEPDISLYLHGEERGAPDVQVVWRADLDPAAPDQWAEIVSLCPPVSLEAMPVPLPDFRRWLTEGETSPAASDIEGQKIKEGEEEEEANKSLRCPVLRWRGDQSDLIKQASDIRPGDTLVLPVASEGWVQLGHIPRDTAKDRAEEAHRSLRRWTLRLHPDLIRYWPDNDAKPDLTRLTADQGAEKQQLINALNGYGSQLENDSAYKWLKEMIEGLPAPSNCETEAYPPLDGKHIGWVLSTRHAQADSGQDESSTSKPAFLDRHLADVARIATQYAASLIGPDDARRSLICAAKVHDYGKADPRFQALLHGGDPAAARFSPKLRAKGDAARQSPAARKAQWARSGLPDGFRHELVSLLLARRDPDIAENDLAKHLIASHHGRCRPFAPVVEDTGSDLGYNGCRIAQHEWPENAAHRLDSGVSDRFWRLTRHYGWWGLAYLEALLRLSDWQASKEEEKS